MLKNFKSGVTEMSFQNENQQTVKEGGRLNVNDLKYRGHMAEISR